MLNLSITNIIQKQEDIDMTSYIRTKARLQQLGEIYCELIKLREGETQHTCRVRNLLQIFGGEMILYCSIDVDNEISSLARLMDEGISMSIWGKINEIFLEAYKKVLRICSVIHK